MRKKSLAMGWIDYRKAFDMMPHSWILECLNILGVNHTVVTFLEKDNERLAGRIDMC